MGSHLIKAWRSGVAIAIFGFAYTFSLLNSGFPFIVPFSFVVIVLVSWELGLFAGLAWIAVVHILIPVVLMMAGIGPFFVFAHSRSSVLIMMLSGIIAETALAFLTARLRTLTEQIRNSQAELLATNEKLQAALDEVKELRGLLPICAWCKKIRDDKGSWVWIETYIARHSHATFTHGLCPDCSKDQLKGLKDVQEQG